MAPGITYTYRCFAGLTHKALGQYIYEVGASDPSNEITVTTPALLTPGFIGKKVIRFNLGNPSYSLDGQTLSMDTAPVIREGRTMLHIRYVTDAVGATLAWDGTTQKVTIVKGDTTIELWIGQNTAMVNGQKRMIDADNPNVRPFIVPPGRTMLPLRFISENLGCEVNWNAELQEASLTYGER